MKKTLVSSALLFVVLCSHAQEDRIRKEIQALEQKSKQAIQQKDSATLSKLWSPTFMVNAPTNMVVKGGQIEMVMSGRISYASFTGELEQILINGDIVITMGHETVVPLPGSPNAGQTIERRYTHVWKKNGESWVLIARHANNVCH
ncbi:MAG: nuclear transport factor 2 family protein [Aquabacterium sp.]|nr:nuclear transport factor 2 family protein [Ferruginibacter sp.]